MEKIKKIKGKHRIAFRIGMGSIIGVLGVGMFFANFLPLVVYSTSIDNVFTSAESSNTNVTTTTTDWNALAKKIEGESITLLKNKNDVLPLSVPSSGSLKVNLLGYRSYAPVFGGSGSGSTDIDTATSLVSALTDNGFDVNLTPLNQGLYTTATSDNYGNTFGGANLSIDETPVAEFTGDSSFENLKSFSDTCIITLGRCGGEGSDLINFTTKDGDGRTYLSLSKDEEALLKKCGETFDKTIVLVNSANPMELGDLDEYNIDAALWIGDPGSQGFESVAEALTGEINPSGRLVDTYAYDVTSAPSYQNFGFYDYDNVNMTLEYYGTQTTVSGKYVNYLEGIYVGYRWYETADVSGYFKDNGTSYEDVVQYPFGYGLSYTSFSEEITGGTENDSTIAKDGTITLDVKVTNTGTVSGKDVVEAYYTAPYTDGGVEKSAVNLAAYGKTDELEPGASQTVALSFNVESMASYDEKADNGNGAYILDKGTYNVSLRSNSHDVVDSIDLNLPSYVCFSSDADGARSTDQVAASNAFQGDNGEGSLTYLSRANGFANYGTVMAQTTPSADEATVNYLENVNDYDSSYDSKVTQKYTEGVDYSATGSLTLDDLAGKNYNDSEWDSLLDQMSLDDMALLIGKGGWSTAEIDSIGKVSTVDCDGPQGLNNFFSTATFTAYPSAICIAATWNKDIAKEFGEDIADEAHINGVTGWYAPAMNIHRSPFGGRTFEYYSEDGLLSGDTAAEVSYGARSKGLITYMKHFALNEQESNRGYSICTWADEQSIRELYLKSFEICAENGESTACMVAKNGVGAYWAGVNEGLMTQVLRNEWGFKGFALTDYASATYMLATASALRAGTDMWLTMNTATVTISSNADIYYAKRACHHILYAEANADRIKSTIYYWRGIIWGVDALLGLGILTAGFFLVRNIVKYKKPRKDEEDKNPKEQGN